MLIVHSLDRLARNLADLQKPQSVEAASRLLQVSGTNGVVAHPEFDPVESRPSRFRLEN
jgi:hypothetical protein